MSVLQSAYLFQATASSRLEQAGFTCDAEVMSTEALNRLREA